MPQKIKELQDQLERIIKGKKDITDKILMAVLAKGHVLLEDVPGVGKTTTALALSRLMGMEFNRIQFTPDVVPSDVTGFTMYDKPYFQQDPVRLSGSNGRGKSDGRRGNPLCAIPVCSHCHRKPGGVFRYAAPSGITA